MRALHEMDARLKEAKISLNVVEKLANSWLLASFSPNLEIFYLIFIPRPTCAKLSMFQTYSYYCRAEPNSILNFVQTQSRYKAICFVE
jgi:hypothetical protein